MKGELVWKSEIVYFFLLMQLFHIYIFFSFLINMLEQKFFEVCLYWKMGRAIPKNLRTRLG